MAPSSISSLVRLGGSPTLLIRLKPYVRTSVGGTSIVPLVVNTIIIVYPTSAVVVACVLMGSVDFTTFYFLLPNNRTGLGATVARPGGVWTPSLVVLSST